MLIWYRRGCKSLSDWRDRFPDDFNLLARLIRVSSALVRRRHWDYVTDLHVAPWAIFAIADPRRTDAVAISQEFLDMEHCCVTFGLARKMHERYTTLAVLLSALVLHGLMQAAFMLLTSIAPLEMMHADGRPEACPSADELVVIQCIG